MIFYECYGQFFHVDHQYLETKRNYNLYAHLQHLIKMVLNFKENLKQFLNIQKIFIVHK